MYRLKNGFVLLVSAILFFGTAGCTVVFQKGRRSDMEKIRELQDEVDRLSQIRADLEEQLKGIQGVSLSMEEKGLVITFLDEVLFDSGKAKIKAEAFDPLNKVASVITSKASDFDIGIEGHTDNVPIKYSGWKSNWELSTARATSVLHYLVEKGVFPVRLAAVGYGEFRPVASNDTAEGRGKNRRVEIVILPHFRKVVPAERMTSETGEQMMDPAENLK